MLLKCSMDIFKNIAIQYFTHIAILRDIDFICTQKDHITAALLMREYPESMEYVYTVPARAACARRRPFHGGGSGNM